MALKTAGTAATTTLAAFVADNGNTAADGATVRANIKWDWDYVNGAFVRVQNGAVFPGGFEFQGAYALLHVPRRGVLKVLPGDYVCYDPNGWPILVSGGAVTSGSGWSHS